jgi:endonuclease I
LNLKNNVKLKNKKVKKMATNGVQLDISTFSGAHITVNGPNQNNQFSQWQGQADGNGEAVTWNWWWKGNVIVADGVHSFGFTAPSFYITDRYPVDLLNLRAG